MMVIVMVMVMLMIMVMQFKIAEFQEIRAVCSDRHDDHDIDASQSCRISEPGHMFTNMDIARNTDTCIMSESVKLLTNLVTARPQHAMEDAFIKTPN